MHINKNIGQTESTFQLLNNNDLVSIVVNFGVWFKSYVSVLRDVIKCNCDVAVIWGNYHVAHIPISDVAPAIRSADTRVNLRNEDTPKHCSLRQNDRHNTRLLTTADVNGKNL